jgi:hypothetical protein
MMSAMAADVGWQLLPLPMMPVVVADIGSVVCCLYIASAVGSYRGCRQLSPLISALGYLYCLLPIAVADVGYLCCR